MPPDGPESLSIHGIPSPSLSVPGAASEASSRLSSAVSSSAHSAIASATSHLRIEEMPTPAMFDRVKCYISSQGGPLGHQTSTGLDRDSLINAVSYACQKKGINIDDVQHFNLSVGSKILTLRLAAGDREIDLAELLTPPADSAGDANFQQFFASMNRLKADAEAVAKSQGLTFESFSLNQGSVKPLSDASISLATRAEPGVLHLLDVNRFGNSSANFVNEMLGVCFTKAPSCPHDINFAVIVSSNRSKREQLLQALELLLERKKTDLERDAGAMTPEALAKKQAALRDVEDLINFCNPQTAYPEMDVGSLIDIKLSLVELTRKWTGNRDLSLEEKIGLANRFRELMLSDKVTGVFNKVTSFLINKVFFAHKDAAYLEVAKESSAKNMAIETVAMLFHVETPPASGTLRKKYMEFLAHMGTSPQSEDLSDLILKAKAKTTGVEKLDCFLSSLNLKNLNEDAGLKGEISPLFFEILS